MFYKAPGGGEDICPIINSLVWGKLSKLENGNNYNWGDSDPTSYLDGFNWGYNSNPFISLISPSVYLCSVGDWIDSGGSLTYSFSWESSNDNITWTPAVGTLSTTYFTNDTFTPSTPVNFLRTKLTVFTNTCISGVLFTTNTYTI